MSVSQRFPLLKGSYEFLCRHIVKILIALLCLGLSIGLIGSYHLSMKLVESQAQQYASISLNTLNKARILYSDNVTSQLKAVEGVTVTPEYHGIAGAIPNPATFSIELSEQLSDRSQGTLFRLYSDYPFPNRQATGGPQDRFEQDALKHLRRNPTGSFHRKEKLNEHVTFRYAEAVRMKPSCVECHNTIASSPKTDWKVGDVRGILTITQPLDNVLLIAQQGLSGIYAVMLISSALAILGITLVMGRFRLMNVELEKKVEERTAELNRLANLDGLTQIANRRHFDQTLEQEWRRALRNNHPIALLLCDVDCFKQYNDTYGHQAGDDCLRAVAQILQNSAKRAGEVVARYGGEEFAVILPSANSDNAVSVANLIRKRLSAFQLPHETSPVDKYVTISIGIAAVLPSMSQTSAKLIRAADTALYEAKEQGRDRHVLWNERSGNVEKNSM